MSDMKEPASLVGAERTESESRRVRRFLLIFGGVTLGLSSRARDVGVRGSYILITN